MATVRELVATFGFDIDDKPLKDMEAGLEHVKGVIVAVGAAAAAAAASMFGLAKATADHADFVDKQSQALSISRGFLQELTHAASLSGTSISELQTGFRTLQRVAFDANRGIKEAGDMFSILNVSVKDSQGNLKDTETLFNEVSAALSEMPEGMQKTGLAMKIFGRAGNQLLPLFNAGAEGIQAMRQEARDLGLVMGDDAVNAGVSFTDNLFRLTQMVKFLSYEIGAGLLPVFDDLFTETIGWIKANKELIKLKISNFINILQAFLSALWRVTKVVASTFLELGRALDSLLSPIGGITTALKGMATAIGLFMLGKLGTAIFSITKGFLLLGKAALFAWKRAFLGPILIGAAVAGIFLIVEDLIAWLQGRPSFLGFLLKNSDQILAAIDNALMQVLGWFDSLGKSIAEKFGLVGEKAEWLGGAIQAVLASVVAFAVVAGAKMAIAFFPVTATIVAVIAAIIAIGYAVMQTIKHWDDIKETFASLWRAMLMGLDNLWMEIKLAFNDGVEWIKSLWTDMIDWFARVGAAAYEAIVNPIKDAFDAVQNKLKSGLGSVKAFFGIEAEGNAPQERLASSFNQAPQSVANTTNAPQQNNLQSTINVTVPPGSDANEIGQAVRQAAADEFGKILRPAYRSNIAQVEY